MENELEDIDLNRLDFTPVSNSNLQFVEAGWTDATLDGSEKAHQEYNDAFYEGYRAGLSDGYNGRTYGLSYDNGDAFFKYSFKDPSNSPLISMNYDQVYAIVVRMVNRNNVSNIYSFYGDTFYENGFAAIKFYDLLPFEDIPQSNTNILKDYEYKSEDDVIEDDLDNSDICEEYEFENFENLIEDDFEYSFEEFQDYKQCGYDDGYKEGFYYGHQRYLDILYDEI